MTMEELREERRRAREAAAAGGSSGEGSDVPVLAGIGWWSVPL
jgi:hypothetical protein